MKRAGMFVARTLSWKGAEFETMEVRLSPSQRLSYDNAVKCWFYIKQEVETALEVLKIATPKTLWRVYWSAHQRFFREMLICVKVPTIIREASVSPCRHNICSACVLAHQVPACIFIVFLCLIVGIKSFLFAH